MSRLGYEFADPTLLRLALTHPSVVHEHGQAMAHNQRLEFLGDAVLQLVLTRELYDRFPHVGEGPLTKARAGLVNRRALAIHARTLGLGDHLILSRGEEINGGRLRSSTLADAFEAIVGAVFLDGGLPAAERFVLQLLREELADVDTPSSIANPKGELQEMLQSSSAHPPDYRVISASGPDHDRVFECTVHHDGRELARGVGKSKKDAEAAAALAALAALDIPRETPSAQASLPAGAAEAPTVADK